MGDVVSSDVSLHVNDLTDSSDVVTTGNEASVSNIVLDPLSNFVVGEVILDCVSLFDLGVWEPDSSGVVGDDVRDFVGANSLSFDLEELELN